MKFAHVDGQRQEAQPNLSGRCPACERPVVAKCGEERTWHWAHQGIRNCDPWWENETEWHRSWKGKFPISWQEVIHSAGNGEKHIADVKTDRGWVIEFRYSHIKPEERRSRNAFYPKLVWVVNGTRRQRDRAQFLRACEHGAPLRKDSPVRTAWVDESVLLREWAGSQVPVFFDFGEEEAIWWLLATSHGWAYVARFARAAFIATHVGGTVEMAVDFDEFVKDLGGLVVEYERARRY